MNFEIVEISSKKSLNQFIDLTRDIYQDSQYFVQPLFSEIKDKITRGKNPFLNYGKINLFGVINEKKKLIGKIAAIINPEHERISGEKHGFFGMFECVNNPVAASLLINRVKTFFCQLGYSKLYGPVNFTTNEECGILIDGFDKSASFMCAYNENYYQNLLESCGMVKAIDMLAYKGNVEHIYPDKYKNILNRVLHNSKVSLRTFDRKRKYEDTRTICSLYNECFKAVWGFVPLSFDEAILMTDKFLTFYDPQLIWIAFMEGTPAGFILGLPDINRVIQKMNGSLFPFGIFKFYLNRKRIDSIRVMTIGVLPQYRGIGLESLLINRIHERMKNAPYEWGEFSFIMENNLRMRKVLENLGFEIYKKYRIYETYI